MKKFAFGLVVIALVATGALAYQAEEQKPNPGMGGMMQRMGEKKEGEQSHQSMQGMQQMMGMMMKMMEQCSSMMTTKAGESKETPSK
jgi:hypothetical protein